MTESKRLYLDANAIIAFVEKINDPVEVMLNVFIKASNLEIELVTSELTLAEVLVKPIRDSNSELAATYCALIGDWQDLLKTAPITVAILERAAALRAESGRLKLPDALHIATAMATSCNAIVWQDKRMAGAAPIEVMDFVNLSTSIAEPRP
jgi:predicted nucleic acid-binding protein